MREATARPWRVGDAGFTVFGPSNGNPSPEVVAICRNRKNATLIVNAINDHELMQRALRRAYDWMRGEDTRRTDENVIDELFDVIEKTKGGRKNG